MYLIEQLTEAGWEFLAAWPGLQIARDLAAYYRRTGEGPIRVRLRVSPTTARTVDEDHYTDLGGEG